MSPQLRFSIRTKLFLGILLPAAMLLLVVYLDYAHLTSLGRSAETILANNYRSIKAAYQINQLLRSRQEFILAALAGGPSLPPVPEDESPHLDELIVVCQNNITEKGEREVVGRLSEGLPSYERLFLALARAQAAGESWPPGRFAELLSAQAGLSQTLDELIGLNETAMERADEETSALAARARRYSVTLLISALCLVLAFSYLIARKISQPLVELAGSLTRIKQGGGGYPSFPVARHDEIGFLTDEFNHLFERLRSYDQMNLELLLAERAKVREAESAKARFIADLSHQLKTPMTSLAMGVGILARKAKTGLPERYARLLETAEEDCGRLGGLINELVGLSRLDAMVEPRPKERLDVAEMVEKCLKPLRLQAEEKGVALRTAYAPGLPPARVDSFRFPWVITNLVGNALRYTKRGGSITLTVAREEDRLLFRCQDTGTGIAPGFLPRVFDRYAQFSEREASGTIGLGLAIVKDIVEAHGGDIAVASQPGQGTTFTFWIPLAGEA